MIPEIKPSDALGRLAADCGATLDLVVRLNDDLGKITDGAEADRFEDLYLIPAQNAYDRVERLLMEAMQARDLAVIAVDGKLYVNTAARPSIPDRPVYILHYDLATLAPRPGDDDTDPEIAAAALDLGTAIDALRRLQPERDRVRGGPGEAAREFDRDAWRPAERFLRLAEEKLATFMDDSGVPAVEVAGRLYAYTANDVSAGLECSPEAVTVVNVRDVMKAHPGSPKGGSV